MAGRPIRPGSRVCGAADWPCGGDTAGRSNVLSGSDPANLQPI